MLTELNPAIDGMHRGKIVHTQKYDQLSSINPTVDLISHDSVIGKHEACINRAPALSDRENMRSLAHCKGDGFQRSACES